MQAEGVQRDEKENHHKEKNRKENGCEEKGCQENSQQENHYLGDICRKTLDQRDAHDVLGQRHARRGVERCRARVASVRR